MFDTIYNRLLLWFPPLTVTANFHMSVLQTLQSQSLTNIFDQVATSTQAYLLLFSTHVIYCIFCQIWFTPAIPA